jgi:hypothetical protein
VPRSLIDAANQEEMREQAARRDIAKVEMSTEARALFQELRTHVLALDSDILELAEPKSVSYHGPAFLEILPAGTASLCCSRLISTRSTTRQG